jgi:acetylornithine/succinyldiaminopimelate/putrescine aminotransferase
VYQDYGAHVMSTCTRYPLTVSYGRGVLLYDTAGREYLDFAASIATSVLGHGDPE